MVYLTSEVNNGYCWTGNLEVIESWSNNKVQGIGGSVVISGSGVN